MQNIPVFTSEFGGATLILQEVPRKGEAYCVVQWAQPGQTPALLAECARFCRMAGARRVLASRLPETPETAPQDPGHGCGPLAAAAGAWRGISAHLQREDGGGSGGTFSAGS